MKRWIGHALLTAGALVSLLAGGRPAAADLIGVTVNSKGSVSGGSAVVSGTITSNAFVFGGCFDYASIYVQVQQIVRGHVVAEGTWGTDDPIQVALTQPWIFAVPPNDDSPPFQAGNAVVTVFAFGENSCTYTPTLVLATANVTLKGR